MLKLEDFLIEMIERKASDLFLKAGNAPCIRIDGQIVPMDFPELTAQDTKRLAERMMTEKQIQQFEDVPELDLALGVPGIGRFRVNVLRQRGSVGMVLRHITNPNFSFEELSLPWAAKMLSEKHRGMVLVTGTTGSGKSTTLAAMINHINVTRKCHIMTIEDPIEFLHSDNQALVCQREIGFDTQNFSDALKHVLRQSPDVILIGEMRDLETIQTAISAAETGHLVMSTLHTTDAVQTIERIINYFPAYLHNQIRMELSLTLQGVLSQRLLPRTQGRGRVPAVEVMVATPLIRKLLHEGRTLELHQYIVQGEEDGMQTFNQSLVRLYQQGLVKYEVALAHATSPDEFRLAAEGIASGTSGTRL